MIKKSYAKVHEQVAKRIANVRFTDKKVVNGMEL